MDHMGLACQPQRGFVQVQLESTLARIMISRTGPASLACVLAGLRVDHIVFACLVQVPLESQLARSMISITPPASLACLIPGVRVGHLGFACQLQRGFVQVHLENTLARIMISRKGPCKPGMSCARTTCGSDHSDSSTEFKCIRVVRHISQTHQLCSIMPHATSVLTYWRNPFNNIEETTSLQTPRRNRIGTWIQ